MSINTSQHMEAAIRRYFDGCNEADVEKMMGCFAADAAHYFPDGAPIGPFVGARAIAEGWAGMVKALGSVWTVDRIVTDERRSAAVIEWTHFKPALGIHLRGDEWYSFDEQGLIAEIRAYYAAPAAAEPRDHMLGGFDYEGRGYALTPPAAARPI